MPRIERTQRRGAARRAHGPRGLSGPFSTIRTSRPRFAVLSRLVGRAIPRVAGGRGHRRAIGEPRLGRSARAGARAAAMPGRASRHFAVFAVEHDDEDEDRGGAACLRSADRRPGRYGRSRRARRANGRPATRADLSSYLQRATLATVAAAVREAFQRMAPRSTPRASSSTFPQPDATETTGRALEVWLCEPDVGSGGTIEELRALTSEDPARLARLVAAAVGPSDLESPAGARGRIIQASEHDAALAAAFAAVRQARSLGRHRRRASRLARGPPRTLGLPSDHAVMSTAQPAGA